MVRLARDWCQDYAMVIIAEDERHAERKARVSSDDFKKMSRDYHYRN